MITHTTYILENNKKIEVFDGLLSLEIRQQIYNFCRSSLFQIGWGDSDVPDRKPRDYFLYSAFSNEDLNRLGIMPYIMNSPIAQSINGLGITKTVLNLGVTSDVNYTHCHPEKKVILYYVNHEWLQGWHGETIFYSEDLTSIQFASPYTPGRIIVFDANIPHTIRPQSTIATHHRFTLAICLDELTNE